MRWSLRTAKYSLALSASAVLLVVLVALTGCTTPSPNAATQDEIAFPDIKDGGIIKVELEAEWTEKDGSYYCSVGGEQLKGLAVLNGKTYLFDDKGRQRNGWWKPDSSYRFFNFANGKDGYMVAAPEDKKKVVQNGVALDGAGRAYENAETLEELALMTRAQKLVAENTKPADKPEQKLKAMWDWTHKNVNECSSPTFQNVKGWHRGYAHEFLFDQKGSCESHAAGFGYLALACGMKKVCIITSIGHAWTEIDGKVYDAEWASHAEGNYFGLAYGENPGGSSAPDYAGATKIRVWISPKDKVWSNAPATNGAGQDGLTKEKGKIVLYRNGAKVTSEWVTEGDKTYFFTESGEAAVGANRADSANDYFVFGKDGVLLKGSGTRVEKVGKRQFQVDADGKAVPGWDDQQAHFYLTTGELATGIRMDGGKLLAFTSEGKPDDDLTKKLQDAFVRDNDPKPLLELLGKPKKVKKDLESCYTTMMEPDLSGVDDSYEYDHIKLSVFRVKDGRQFIESIVAL